MAMVQLLGEQVNKLRQVDERTAFSIEEILAERDYQDEKYSGLQGQTSKQVEAANLAKDKKLSGTDWNNLIDEYQKRVKPDMMDPETRKAFVKLAALALAALRAS